MAQRVFLVPIPVVELEAVVSALCGDANQRNAIAGRLAHQAMPHFRRVAASERVCAAAEGGGKELPDPFSLPRNLFPYLLAATKADDIIARLDAVSEIERDDALEDFFIGEARKLGVEPGVPDRSAFRAPDEEKAADWIADLLAKIADLRTKAVASGARSAVKGGELTPLGDYAVSTWVWLARIFARTGPCFWQGRNRWIGLAVMSEPRTIETTIWTFGTRTLWNRVRDWLGFRRPVDPEMERIAATLAENTLASGPRHDLPELHDLLTSTALLAPRLSMEAAQEVLPPEGAGNLASGVILRDRLAALVARMKRVIEQKKAPFEDGDTWAEIVIASARVAERSDAHLIEADDALPYAYRWPMF